MNLLQNFEPQHWESRMDDPITSEVSTSAKATVGPYPIGGFNLRPLPSIASHIVPKGRPYHIGGFNLRNKKRQYLRGFNLRKNQPQILFFPQSAFQM